MQPLSKDKLQIAFMVTLMLGMVGFTVVGCKPNPNISTSKTPGISSTLLTSTQLHSLFPIAIPDKCILSSISPNITWIVTTCRAKAELYTPAYNVYVSETNSINWIPLSQKMLY